MITDEEKKKIQEKSQSINKATSSFDSFHIDDLFIFNRTKLKEQNEVNFTNVDYLLAVNFKNQLDRSEWMSGKHSPLSEFVIKYETLFVFNSEAKFKGSLIYINGKCVRPDDIFTMLSRMEGNWYIGPNHIWVDKKLMHSTISLMFS
jgi:uncharacterized protein (DUF885 family)